MLRTPIDNHWRQKAHREPILIVLSTGKMAEFGSESNFNSQVENGVTTTEITLIKEHFLEAILWGLVVCTGPTTT